ncbi:MAG: Rab family GTPase [Pseudomonadota bacterium]
MVGDFAVGKTSLTQKFVNNIFSEKYLTTIGVKIDSAMVGDTKLIVWDVAGRDAQSPINTHYLVGADGVILVGDGTRSNTVDALEKLWQTTTERTGEIPMVVALNKHDDPDWSISAGQQQHLQEQGWTVFHTSAKNGENVREMFEALTGLIS